MTFFPLLLLLSLHSLSAAAEGGWCYETEVCKLKCHGPRDWKDSTNSCDGKKQSPINIVTNKAEYLSSLKEFKFEGYDKDISGSLKNNGHSAQLDLLADANIKISSGGLEGTYLAKQLHFHWGKEDISGSEHHIDGEKFPMELHIVHLKETGEKYAVLGFMIEESTTDNPKYNHLIEALNKIPFNGNNITVSNMKLQELIPDQTNLNLYYRYEGSLTTPACDEIVTWTIFPEPIKLSKEQISVFYEKLHFASNDTMEENYRPVQALNGRIVYYSSAEAILSQCLPLLMSLVVFCLLTTS